MFGSYLLPIVCMRIHVLSYLRYLCWLANIVLCLCFACLRPVYAMLPVSLDYPFFDCPIGIL
jgi:hypothetical protein